MARIARFSLTTAGADRLATFYEEAFGCRPTGADRLEGPAFEKLMDVRGSAARITLRLGAETIEMLQFDDPGTPYPVETSASDPVFQHFAIVVSDIGEAYRRLLVVSGWTPITRGGPQKLPQSSGGVTAFKFRDPDGHPLELLAFEQGCVPVHWAALPQTEICLGIDHSAISVSDTAASKKFYERLGFGVSAKSFNQGPEQAMLDDIDGVKVDVIALTLTSTTPHLELLGYRSSPHVRRVHRSNDIASTRIVLKSEAAGIDPVRIEDCDGHHLLIVRD